MNLFDTTVLDLVAETGVSNNQLTSTLTTIQLNNTEIICNSSSTENCNVKISGIMKVVMQIILYLL